MKLKNIFLSLTLAVCSAFAMKHFWRGATLSEAEVAKRWGTSELNTNKFKTGDEKVRASMAYSILKNQKALRGKFVVDLRNDFGRPDGFYFSDVFPAYMIQRGQGDQDESWQLVFLPNKERKVEDIIVHKNCCD